MARTFNGSTQYGTLAKAFLASSGGPFTVSLWFTPANLTDAVKAVLSCGTAVGAYWQLRLDSGTVVFESGGYSGTNPGTSSGISWSPFIGLKHVAWRYKGQSAEWSKWNAGAKTVINSSISFTLPSPGARFDIARNWSGANCAGTYGEVAIWSTALPDEYMAELAAGVAPDQLVAVRGALLGYWPLRGNNSPEPSYVVTADALTLGSSPTQATHPTVVPPWNADVVANAWVVDLFHPNGTKRGASCDLSEDVDFDVLGAAYRSRLLNDPTITESDPTEQAGGVMQPAQTTIELENVDGWLDRSWEWRQCPVRIREYDRVSHALVTEFVGIIIDPGNVANDRAVFTCGGADEFLLDQPVPRVVIEAGTAGSGLLDNTDLTNVRRADVGKPVPVVFGVGMVSSPFFKEDDTGSPGGGDFAVAWGTSAYVSAVWFDLNLDSPGLENGLAWAAAPGSPVSATTTTFTVTGNQSTFYVRGTLLRQSSDGGTTWKYTTVASYASGTVTVADAVLPVSPASIGLLQSGGECIVEKDRWKYVSGAGTTFLTTVRFPNTPNTAVLVRAGTPLTNPADVIKFLLEDPDQGLGQSCNALAFAVASIVFAAAGLGAAVNGHVGGDGSQRQLLGVLNELCAMRGAELWRDPETSEWMIRVDTAPVIQSRALEFGPGLTNAIGEVLSVRRTPLGQAVSTLTLRYQPGGRARGGVSFYQQDYAYRASMTVTAGISGVRQTIESQFLRADAGTAHAAPARVLYYRGKRLQRSDQQITFRMNRNGRRVRRGMVFPVTIPSAGLSTPTNFRIVGRQRTLNEFVFTAHGPYDPDIYESNLATINAALSLPTAEVAPEDAPAVVSPTNLLLNADFSAGVVKAGLPTPATNYDAIPHWIVGVPGGGGTLTALSVTRDPGAVGGCYLTIGVGVAATGTSLGAWADLDAVTSGYAVMEGEVYIFSVYLDSTAAGGPTANWTMEIGWRNAAGGFVGYDVFDRIRAAPGEVNGLGHQRYYSSIRAPAGAAYASPVLRFTADSTTYKVSAVQFELRGNIFGRPGTWTRNMPYGIEPASMLQGDQKVRVSGDPEAGAKLTQQAGANYATGGQTLSGTSTVVGSAGPGLLKNLTGRVTTAVTGPASFSLALDFGGGALTTVLDALPVSANSTFGDSKAVSLPIFLPAAVNIVAIPASGSFSGGKVKVLANVEVGVPPTS